MRQSSNVDKACFSTAMVILVLTLVLKYPGFVAVIGYAAIGPGLAFVLLGLRSERTRIRLNTMLIGLESLIEIMKRRLPPR